MLNYRINTRKFNKTKTELAVENVSFTDFETLVDNCILTSDYDGNKLGKIIATCKCSDIDKVSDGGTVSCVNVLYLDYGITNQDYQETYTFNDDCDVIGVNKGNKSFSFYYDKYVPLNVDYITSGENNEDKIIIYFKDFHYFDTTDQDIKIRFRYTKNNGSVVEKNITFNYLLPMTLVTSYDDFDSEIYTLIFGTNKQQDSNVNKKKYVNRFNSEDKITEEQYQALEDTKKTSYIVVDTSKECFLGNIEVFRENFLFGEKTQFYFTYERPLADINVPIVNTFETTLYQMELLNEHFVDAEKKKAINGITDIEKDVYYPCISNGNQDVFNNVYTIKFNLHFREHRGDDWLVENESFWNCIEKDDNDKARVVKVETNDLTADDMSDVVEDETKGLTADDMSDLLSFLGFTNNDVHYQKNKLKKSFLRLMYYDSMNPGNQNMIGYSTIFFDTGEMFSKYVKYIEDENTKYTAINADKEKYGVYNPVPNKNGIRVDRESWDEEKRLSSQLVVKSKNLSKASSEGFYIYIWKDNEMAYPQDLYVKVEFNHAGYGRTIPFMMPYWDGKKWGDDKKAIKTLEQILDDWNDTKALQNGKVIWANGTDGHYGIRQYTKFSYIHLKYRYDKENDKHIYYLDPETYGNSVTDTTKNQIVINLYEAKVE